VICHRQFHVPRGGVRILLDPGIRVGYSRSNEPRLRERFIFFVCAASPFFPSLVNGIHGGNN
jgi:hypothetical protein